MKIITLVGARPHFIKADALSRAIRCWNKQTSKNENRIEEVLVHTGQHYDFFLSDIFFEELELEPALYNLEIGSASSVIQISSIIEKFSKIVEIEKPDYILVYGDTNSTLAGALTASKMEIPLIHVEAGIRSYDLFMQEEQNRIMTDQLSTYLFCPSKAAVQNLKKENIVGKKSNSNCYNLNQKKIESVGDITFDTYLYYSQKIKNDFGNREASFNYLDFKQGALPILLVTIHRAENTKKAEQVISIMEALEKASEFYQIIFPIHPRTKKLIPNARMSNSSIHYVHPVSYLDMIFLQWKSSLILTDSGGIQKESYFSQTPCLTLRTSTEWRELMKDGLNALIENIEDLFPALKKSLINLNVDFSGKNTDEFFGDGTTATRIVRSLTGEA